MGAVAHVSVWLDEWDDCIQTRHAGVAVHVGGLSFTVDSEDTGRDVAALINRLADDPRKLHELAQRLEGVAFRMALAADETADEEE